MTTKTEILKEFEKLEICCDDCCYHDDEGKAGVETDVRNFLSTSLDSLLDTLEAGVGEATARNKEWFDRGYAQAKVTLPKDFGKMKEETEESWQEEWDNLYLDRCGKWKIDRLLGKEFIRGLLHKQKEKLREEVEKLPVYLRHDKKEPENILTKTIDIGDVLNLFK